MKKHSVETTVVSARVPLSVAMRLQMAAMKQGLSLSAYLRPYLIAIANDGSEVDETIAAEINYHIQQAKYLANVLEKANQIKEKLENERETT